ncbi:MATE family efflux transporter [Evansella sp. AB-rgal1]|uniref:MATE family efflux transporter n=1 Tax=Evansella sp. AB-rgal1 TaxID=3242696 RepID=UPI00359EAA58
MEFRREVRILVIPFVIHMLLSNSFSFVDLIMITRLGEVAVASVAAAGQFSFILGMLLSATYGITAFITQFFGKNDMKNVHRSLGIMLTTSIVLSSIVSIVVFLFKTQLLSIFLHDETALLLGVQYLSIIVFVYVLNAMKDSYGNALGAIGKVKINVIIGFIGLGTNTLLNYLLIYGNFGFPELGIQGAAYATLYSTILSTTLLLGFIYGRKYHVNASIKSLFSFNKKFMKKVYIVTIPLIFHEGIWSIGNMLYAVAFGYMGVTALATYQLARSFNNYFMMGIFGFSYAAKVMIGKRLSLEDPSEAILNARKFTKLSVYSAITVSVLIILLNPVIVSLFTNLSSEVQQTFRNVLYIQGFVLTMYFLNNIWIVGVFRSGGDNIYSMKLVLFTTWGIALPLVFLGAFVFHWPIEVVYLMFALEEVSKACIGFFRYRSNKWANNLVRDIA